MYTITMLKIVHMLVPEHVMPIWISLALGSLYQVASQAPLPPILL
jgi:hypothetical protein